VGVELSYRKLIEIGLDGNLVSVTFDQTINVEAIEKAMIDGMRIVVGQNAINKQRQKNQGVEIINPNNGKPILKN